MKRFTESVRRSISDSNWHAALSLSLMLPDICGRLERPNEGSKARYVRWFDEWLSSTYTRTIGGQLVTFLSGSDCYALRCALIHEGSDDIAEQKARDALSRFIFVAPNPSIYAHNNAVNGALQLQVDVFCEDVCSGVDRWSEKHALDSVIFERMKALIEIHDISNGIPGFISFGPE